MSIENLTLKEIKEVSNLFGNNKQINKPHPFSIGKNYFIRTVTMILVGKLEEVYDNELVLSTAAWVADTGRFADCLKYGEKIINEIEPFQDSVIVGRGSIIDMTIWNHDLLINQK